MLSIETTRLAIPTYSRGPDAPFAPLSFSGQVQGRRTAYPYHAQDDIDIASMVRDEGCEHTVVRLSNGILEALILPGLNGRMYSLRDLRSGRELFYRNHVVKPALVALRGAWLSGGIEFNFPTLGHTVSTVSPVFCRTEQSEHEVAVIIGDIDRSTRQRWQVRLALRAGRAALDVELLFANPNHHRERLYYWENAAVPAATDLRFVCRCDWTVGSTSLPFPLRDGVDRSLHVTNPTPLDHFGYRSHADFFGAYYLDHRRGTYHVAPRFSLPGQKYFTWGIREDNRIWEHYLTDHDGQYVEIQAGVLESQWFSDWLQPQETLSAGGSWFGTEDMGEVTWASPQLAVAATAAAGLGLEVYAIEVSGDLDITVANAGGTVCRRLSVTPGSVARAHFPDASPGLVDIRDSAGRLLLRQRWHGPEAGSLDPARDHTAPTQWSMRARSQSAVGKATVALQYHRWHEAQTILNQEIPPEHMREKALLQAERSLKIGQADDALQTARQALDTFPAETCLHALAATAALRRLHETAQAPYYSAAWDHLLAARRDPGLAPAMLRLLAEAEVAAGHLPDAARLLTSFVAARPAAIDARVLLAAVQRHCGDPAAARAALVGPQTPFTLYLTLEGWLQADPAAPALSLPELPADRPWAPIYRAELLLEAVLLYWRAGFHADVVRLLDRLESEHPALARHPGAALLRMDASAGDAAAALAYAITAAACPADWVVPARWEMNLLLERASQRLADRSQGCLPYLRAQAAAEADDVPTAIELFTEVAASRQTTLRALAAKALADWADSGADCKADAIAHLQTALAAWPGDRRLLLHLDDCQRALHDCERRTAMWHAAPAALSTRGDVVFALARLDLDRGQPEAAIERLLHTEFSVFEGGTAVRRLYVDALLVAAIDAFRSGQGDLARQRCRQVFEYPENLGAAAWLGEHSRLARYLLGRFAELSGQTDEARTWWDDVLSRAGAGLTYTVGGEGAASVGRMDEHVALILADRHRHGTRHPEPPEAPLPERADAAAHRLSEALAAGSPQMGALATAALQRFPCDPLLRILAQLARLE